MIENDRNSDGQNELRKLPFVRVLIIGLFISACAIVVIDLIIASKWSQIPAMQVTGWGPRPVGPVVTRVEWTTDRLIDFFFFVLFLTMPILILGFATFYTRSQLMRSIRFLGLMVLVGVAVVCHGYVLTSEWPFTGPASWHFPGWKLMQLQAWNWGVWIALECVVGLWQFLKNAR